MYHFQGFSEKADAALENAVKCAEDMGHNYVGSEHILAGLLKDHTNVASVLLSSRKITYASFYEVIKMNIGIGVPTRLCENDITPRGRKIISEASVIAAGSGSILTGTEHILAAILREKQCFACRALMKMGVSAGNLYQSSVYSVDEGKYEKGKSTQHSHGRASALGKYGRNLTQAAISGKLDPVTGRDREIDRVIKILCRKTKNNPCLVGEPGVGKTAVVEGLAIRTARGDVPSELNGTQVISLDLTAMVAGAKYRGDFEERIKNAVAEAEGDSSIILFIDEVHNLTGAGSAEGAVDAANILKPVLSRGGIRLIGATTAEEYRKNIEKDAALERRFQTVSVEEPSRDEALGILRSLRESYEGFHGVRLPDETLEAAVDMSVRYINDRFLPDKAIDLVDEAAAGVNISRGSQKRGENGYYVNAEFAGAISAGELERAAEIRENAQKKADEGQEESYGSAPVVTPEHIAECVSVWTGIPSGKICGNDRERLLTLEDRLSEEIIGQAQAVKCVARAVRRGRAGVSDPRRPVCTLLFSGPTGVGKTELAKALARELFPGRDALIRVDMSELSEKHSVSRLIGAPPGYQGFDEGGQLVNKIRRMPYCVILFDEIEKAHPDVFNFLLPVLEDGVLTAGDGKRADCRNAVIIMTANVGSAALDKGISMGFFNTSEESERENIRAVTENGLKSIFSPEFRGRIDEVVIFTRPVREDVEKIAVNMLGKTASRLEKQGISLEIAPEVYSLLAEKGCDSSGGVRSLRRLVVSEIEAPLADIVIECGNIKKVSVKINDGVPVFSTEIYSSEELTEN